MRAPHDGTIEQVWAADAVPLGIRIEEEGARRPVALLVTAGDALLHRSRSRSTTCQPPRRGGGARKR